MPFAKHLHPCAGAVQSPRGDHGGTCRPAAGVHAGFKADVVQAARPVRPQPDLGRLRGPGEQHDVAIHVEHTPDLKVGRRDGYGVGKLGGRRGEQPSRAIRVGSPHQVPGGGPGGHPGHDVQPRVVARGMNKLASARCRIGPQDAHLLLAAVLDDE